MSLFSSEGIFSVVRDMYDIDGFQIRFFEEHIDGFQIRSLVKYSGFEILDIKEVYEEPVTLYIVSTRKT